MKTSVNLDEEMARELQRTVSLVREDTATVLRMAIRAGLPVVVGLHDTMADRLPAACHNFNPDPSRTWNRFNSAPSSE